MVPLGPGQWQFKTDGFAARLLQPVRPCFRHRNPVTARLRKGPDPGGWYRAIRPALIADDPVLFGPEGPEMVPKQASEISSENNGLELVPI